MRWWYKKPLRHSRVVKVASEHTLTPMTRLAHPCFFNIQIMPCRNRWIGTRSRIDTAPSRVTTGEKDTTREEIDLLTCLSSIETAKGKDTHTRADTRASTHKRARRHARARAQTHAHTRAQTHTRVPMNLSFSDYRCIS